MSRAALLLTLLPHTSSNEINSMGATATNNNPSPVTSRLQCTMSHLPWMSDEMLNFACFCFTFC